ncbi:MAG: trypsin-like peptidase domain-containing protein [Verrucomicrobia bacterium]|nr:trypsin-like peptidase domain-containing protein [Verrucomicrobiota bacterium]
MQTDSSVTAAGQSLGLAGVLLQLLSVCLAVGLGLGCRPAADNDPVPGKPGVGSNGAVSLTPDPVRMKDLEALEAKVIAVTARVRPAVVAVGHTGLESAASGVIISPDGLVLSQFHVTHARRDGSKGEGPHASSRRTFVILDDGRRCEAELLGASQRHDLSLLRLVDRGPYPWVPLEPASDLLVGQWILKLGHPGHYQKGRRAVVRLGRIRALSGPNFATDCLVNGGDSGGPFFDLEGRLVGIVLGATADLTKLVQEEVSEFSRDAQFVFAGTRVDVIAAELEAMKRGVVDVQRMPGYDLPLLAAKRLPARSGTYGSAVRSLFDPVVQPLGRRVVSILKDETSVALGMIVEGDSSGVWVLTKASEIPERPKCRWTDQPSVSATVEWVFESDDLALLRVPLLGDRGPGWVPRDRPAVGEWAVVPGPEGVPRAVGNVSVERTERMPTWSEANSNHGANRPYFPVLSRRQANGYELVERVFGRGAYEAGLRSGDLIRPLGTGGGSNDSLFDMVSRRSSPGPLLLEVNRSGQTFEISLPLPVTSGGYGYSRNSGPFPEAFEIAVPMDPSECGAPVLDRQGRLVGILAARHELQGCRVIPASRVEALLVSRGRTLETASPKF